MNRAELEIKAEELVSSLSDAVLTSVNEEGYPRSCFLGIIGHDSPWVLYFSTGYTGVKTAHFRANPKASVAYADIAKNNGVTLVGTAEITEELSVKERLWRDWMYEYFPDGAGDENFCLIRFTAKEVTYWIEKNFGTIRLDG